jgi:hypothetical protein
MHQYFFMSRRCLVLCNVAIARTNLWASSKESNISHPQRITPQWFYFYDFYALFISQARFSTENLARDYAESRHEKASVSHELSKFFEKHLFYLCVVGYVIDGDKWGHIGVGAHGMGASGLQGRDGECVNERART